MKGSEGQLEDKRTDEELILEHLAGDADAFNVLYERYRKPLYGYLNRLVPGRHAVVDDIFQQTWIKAINQFGKYERKRQFISWLLCIAHNLAIDLYRSEKTAGNQAAPIEEMEESLAAGDLEPWRDLDEKELGAALNDALEKLSPELKEVFLLRQDDIAFKDIAEIQDCSINTVLSRMQYALKSLRKGLCSWRNKKDASK